MLAVSFTSKRPFAVLFHAGTRLISPRPRKVTITPYTWPGGRAALSKDGKPRGDALGCSQLTTGLWRPGPTFWQGCGCR